LIGKGKFMTVEWPTCSITSSNSFKEVLLKCTFIGNGKILIS